MGIIEPILKRSRAAAEVVKSKKHSDKALYAVLVDCMKIAEICSANTHELTRLNQRIVDLPLLPGRNRVYVEKSSGLFQRVCRVVFHGIGHTQNINRYAIALHEATKLDVGSAGLMDQLMDHGGVHRLWLRRPKASTLVRTRTLYLQRQIEHAKASEFTLTLKLRKDGSYAVSELDGCRFGVT